MAEALICPFTTVFGQAPVPMGRGPLALFYKRNKIQANALIRPRIFTPVTSTN